MYEALFATRLIHFAAAMAGFGGAAFRLYAVGDEAARGTAAAPESFDRWLTRVIQASALVMLASGLTMVPIIAAGMAGTVAGCGAGICCSPRCCWRAPVSRHSGTG